MLIYAVSTVTKELCHPTGLSNVKHIPHQQFLLISVILRAQCDEFQPGSNSKSIFTQV